MQWDLEALFNESLRGKSDGNTRIKLQRRVRDLQADQDCPLCSLARMLLSQSLGHSVSLLSPGIGLRYREENILTGEMGQDWCMIWNRIEQSHRLRVEIEDVGGVALWNT